MRAQARSVLYSVDFRQCAALAVLTPGEIIAAFVTALEQAGATVVQQVSYTFPGAGLTSVLILRESHAAIHTWPETGTVNLDIFSCTTRLKSLEAVADLGRALGAQHVSIQEVPRTDGHRPDSSGRRA